MKDELKKDLLNHLHQQANTVTITSTASLDDSEIADIKKSAGIDPKANVLVKVDPSLLGGVVIQKGSRIIDLSLGTKLDNLRNQIV